MSSSSRWAPANAARPERPVWTSARVTAAKQQSQGPKAVEAQTTTASISSQARAKVESIWAAPPAGRARPPPAPRARPSAAPAPEPALSSAASTSKLPTSSREQLSNVPKPSTSSAPAFVRRQDKQLGGQVDPMALIASPSRGLDASEAGRNIARVATGQEDASESMDLTNAAVQANFRAYISRRIASHVETHGRPEASYALPTAPSKPKAQQEARQHSWEQIGLLCRKLREGIVASGRADAFAIEAYTISTYVSLFANNLNQLHTSLSRLVLHLYAVVPTSSSAPDASTHDLEGILPSEVLQDSHRTRAFMASLYLLLQAFPSSGTGRIGGEKAAAAADAGRSGAWWATRNEVLSNLDLDRAEEDWTGLAEALRSATIVTDSLRLRSLLLGTRGFPTPSTLHLRLVALALPSFRARAWRTIQRAYMTVPFDETLVGSPSSSRTSSWLEERLLLDVDVCPPTEEEVASTAPTSSAPPTRRKDRRALPPPDSWEEDGDCLSASVEGLSLAKGDGASSDVVVAGVKMRRASLNAVRAERLAAFLDAVGLAPLSSAAAAGAGEKDKGAALARAGGTGAMERWKERVIDAPGMKDGSKGFKVR